MRTLESLMSELAKPFHPASVTWKPGAVAKGGGKALALAYADLRAYQNRLDEVAGADWSVRYVPWGDRIICELTICGVTRTSTGEADSQSERSEIAGTAAEAQAFKRACAMFGLGRYLYNLPSTWAEYDSERKQFTEPAKAKLLGILMQHYRQATGRAPETGGDTGDAVSEATRKHLHALGTELYGEQWDAVRHRNVRRVTGGRTESSADLTEAEAQRLIDGMNTLKRQRAAANHQRVAA